MYQTNVPKLYQILDPAARGSVRRVRAGEIGRKTLPNTLGHSQLCQMLLNRPGEEQHRFKKC